MRVLFILGGAALLHRFEWLMYIFGVFLVYTGLKMLFEKIVVRALRTLSFLMFVVMIPIFFVVFFTGSRKSITGTRHSRGVKQK